MATAENSTVKLYSGVPLVKNGTEVLFLSGAAAEGALSGYTAATFTKYYYTRENRGAVQVESPIAPLEGVNYIAFQNLSHGGKWYFGFIDRLVYINDNNTQVEFTIDPFPTYLGDCTEFDDYFVIRNTPRTDVRGANTQTDFVPPGLHKSMTHLSDYSVRLDTNVVYYAGKYGGGVIDGTGNIRVGVLTDAALEAIQQTGGAIIGGYMFPSAWGGDPIAPSRTLAAIHGNATAHLLGAYMEKIRTGVYNKVVLFTSQGSKSYDLEQFADPTNVTFQIIGLTIPSPALFAYPLNYNGIHNNVAEGVMCKAPSVPISANATYTNAQGFADIVGGLVSMGGAAASGFAMGGPAGAALAAATSGLSAVVNQAKNYYMTDFQTPHIYGTGEPITDSSKTLFVSLAVCSPDTGDLDRIDAYLRYFGYAQNCFSSSTVVFPGGVNQEDGAYLQTGSDMFGGSEKAAEINARIAAGIKIRKTL